MSTKQDPEVPAGNLGVGDDSAGSGIDVSMVRAGGGALTRADRAALATLARKRAKLAKAMLGERAQALRADVEDQLAATYQFDDALWVQVNREAEAAVARADARVAEACRQAGIPEHVRPSLQLEWRGRGDNALASRRAELRKLAHARIDAAVSSAQVAIEAALLDVETELIRDGLQSAVAVEWLESMPTAEQLLPVVDVRQLATAEPTAAVEDYRGHFGGWSPPPDTSGMLLTPGGPATRAEKRQAVARAAAAHPGASDREIARRAGVDHKTAGKLRTVAAEVPAVAGEVPAVGGEVPTPAAAEPGESPS